MLVSKFSFTTIASEEKLFLNPKADSVRQHVPWLPTVSSSAAVPHPGSSQVQATLQDFHREFLEKVSSPNRSLKSVEGTRREIEKPASAWKAIFDEFQKKKKMEKKTKEVMND